MKNILTKHFLFIALFASITNFCIASPSQLQDTTLIAANSTKSSAVAVREANVEYPALLVNEKEQSIAYVQKFTKTRRDYLIKMHKEGEKYFPQIISALQKQGLPEELKVIVPIESDFKGNVVSRSGAVGYWQMMDAIALDYGLSIGKSSKGKKKRGPDERKNLFKSTVAATKFLKDLYTQFNNDVLLTVASYNCGPNAVLRAIKKSGINEAGFWDISKYLPAETRAYVMKFITLNVIFGNYDNFESNNLLFAPQMIQNYNPDTQTIVN
jgi:soluble lytic murein transglycosylase-like protein